jgi:acyl-CoA thioesterase-2
MGDRDTVPPSMDATLAEILDIEKIDHFLYRGVSRPTSFTRIFGGEVAAQALVAAGRTVPADRKVHSLHGYFLRPGDASVPIIYRVEATRDGGAFTTRRVICTQFGEPIFQLAASFQTPEEGLSHQVPKLAVTAPEELPPGEVTMARADPETQAWFAMVRERFPIELRFTKELPRAATRRGEAGQPQQQFWLRAAAPLPDDPLVHVCAVTYASDMMLLSSSLPPHRLVIGQPGLQFASLDHAIWFHSNFRADDWLFYDQQGTWAGSGRALCRGMFFDRAGVLVASVMQEGLVRVRG